MIAVTSIHRRQARTSLTKARRCHGLQQMLQQCPRVSIWVNKQTDAACLT
jgi:hypothetical protein